MTKSAAVNFELPKFGFGGGPLGGIRASITDKDAHNTLEAAWTGGMRYFDTAPWYGNTKSEERFGAFLKSKPRNEFILTTKVGRLYTPPAPGFDFEASKWRQRWPGGGAMVPHFDYTYQGIMRSYEDSLKRLGIDRVDALAIHDLDIRHHKTEENIAVGLSQLTDKGGFRALTELKTNGDIKAIGAGINLPGYIARFLERFKIDYFLLAMPYTLVEQQALDVELPLCAEHGCNVVVGAPFASGILATGATPNAQYAYAPASEAIKSKVAKLALICANHRVELPAVALHFPLGHPVVTSVVFGAESPAQIKANLAASQAKIPASLWQELKAENLIAPNNPTP